MTSPSPGPPSAAHGGSPSSHFLQAHHDPLTIAHGRSPIITTARTHGASSLLVVDNYRVENNTMCGETFSLPLLCVVPGQFPLRNYRRSAKESMPNHVRRDCQRSITATIPTRQLELKLERNHGCCFTTTKMGKPSSLLCPEAAYRPAQKGPKGLMVP